MQNMYAIVKMGPNCEDRGHVGYGKYHCVSGWDKAQAIYQLSVRRLCDDTGDSTSMLENDLVRFA